MGKDGEGRARSPSVHHLVHGVRTGSPELLRVLAVPDLVVPLLPCRADLSGCNRAKEAAAG